MILPRKCCSFCGVSREIGLIPALLQKEAPSPKSKELCLQRAGIMAVFFKLFVRLGEKVRRAPRGYDSLIG